MYRYLTEQITDSSAGLMHSMVFLDSESTNRPLMNNCFANCNFMLFTSTTTGSYSTRLLSSVVPLDLFTKVLQKSEKIGDMNTSSPFRVNFNLSFISSINLHHYDKNAVIINTHDKNNTIS